MNTFLRPFFFSFTMYTAACGCITNSGSGAYKNPQTLAAAAAPTSAEDAFMAKTRVRSELQKKMLTSLKAESDYTKAYGLFSEGGWSDDGQTWILANGDLTKTAAYRIDANKEDPRKIDVKPAQLDQLKKLLPRARGLTEIDEEMFDGLIYELTVLETTGQELTAATSLYIKSTDLTRHPEHNALINAFRDLSKP